MKIRWLGLGLASALAGCSHFTTYQADIGTPTTGVSFDAKQRLMIVNKSAGKPDRICTEPSPDALASLGASLGGSFLTASGSTKQLAAALGENAASIGLRTTSIQLLRDSMYRVCEAYLNGGISPEMYGDLQAHAQTLVVGLLAIEQLTGTVRAQQVALISNAGAGGMPDVAGEAQTLIDMKKETAQKQIDWDAAKRTKDGLDQERADKKKQLDAASAAKDTPQEDLDRLKQELDEITVKVEDADADLKTKSALLEVAKQAEAVAQNNFDLARTRVRAAVNGAATFGQDAVSKGALSDEAVGQLSHAVNAIVSTVIGVSIESQKCLTIMTSDKFAAMPDSQRNAIERMCAVVADTEKTRIENTRPVR